MLRLIGMTYLLVLIYNELCEISSDILLHQRRALVKDIYRRARKVIEKLFLLTRNDRIIQPLLLYFSVCISLYIYTYLSFYDWILPYFCIQVFVYFFIHLSVNESLIYWLLNTENKYMLASIYLLGILI